MQFHFLSKKCFRQHPLLRYFWTSSSRKNGCCRKKIFLKENEIQKFLIHFPTVKFFLKNFWVYGPFLTENLKNNYYKQQLLCNSGQNVNDLSLNEKFKTSAQERKLGGNYISDSFCGFHDGSKEEEHLDCDECALDSEPLDRYLQIFSSNKFRNFL